MVEEIERIVSEINQIKKQYVAEVGSGGRRAWPKSIKDRIARLDELGVRGKQIAECSGVSYETIMSWRCKRKKKNGKGPISAPAFRPAFHEISVANKLLTNATVTVAESGISGAKVSKNQMRLQTPEGFVIEGLSEEGILRLIHDLRSGGRHAS